MTHQRTSYPVHEKAVITLDQWQAEHNPDGSSKRADLTATATLDFASIAAATTANLTITVTGAAVNDAVLLGPPATLEAGLVATGYVSAANTVTVRVANVTAGAIDPASATWRATIFQP